MQTSNCNSLLNLDKPIFAEEISDSLFVSDQQRVGNQHTGVPMEDSGRQIIHLTPLKGHQSQADQVKNYKDQKKELTTGDKFVR